VVERMKYIIKGIGKVILNENSLKMELSISPNKFLELLDKEIEASSPQTKQTLRKAVKTNDAVKIKNFPEFKKFFDSLYESVESGKIDTGSAENKQNLFEIITKQTAPSKSDEMKTIENNPFILGTSKSVIESQQPQEQPDPEKIFQFFEKLQKKEDSASVPPPIKSPEPSASDTQQGVPTPSGEIPLKIDIINIDSSAEAVYCELVKHPLFSQKKFEPEIYGHLKTAHYFDGSEISQEYMVDTLFALVNNSNSPLIYYSGSFGTQWMVEGFNIQQNEKICKQKVLELNEFSILGIKRHISTRNDPKVPSLVIEPGKETTILYSFQLENKSDYVLKEIAIKQVICKAFIEEQYPGADPLQISDHQEGRLFTFAIKEINPKSTKIIDIRFKLSKEADPTKDLFCGKAEIEYYVPNFDFKFDKDNAQIVLPIETGMKLVQLEEKPEFCEISPFFTNPTDLSLKLASFKIIDRLNNSILYESPDSRIIFPLTKQVSYIEPIELNLDEAQHFRIGTEFRFSPIHPGVFSLLRVVASLENKSIGLPDVKLEFAHSIDKIFLGKTKEFSTQITIENIGNTEFDSFSLEFRVSDGYSFGDLSNLELIKEEISVKDSDLYKITHKEKELSIIFDSHGQNKNEDSAFKIDEILGIKVPIICNKAELNKPFSLFIHSVYNKQAEAKISIEKNAESPSIEIVQPNINLEIKRTFNPTESPDIYEIIIELKNQGNYQIENRKIYAEIPSNFEFLKQEQSNYSNESIANKNYITYLIKSIHPNETTQLKYRIRILDSKSLVFS
jgi:hypothetical protein